MFSHERQTDLLDKLTGHLARSSCGRFSWPSSKTTGRIKTLLLFLLLLALPATAPAAEITFTTSNDPVSGNERPDDLYTAELALELALDERDLVLTERMFTDRERGVRFDETSLELSRSFRRLAGWSGEAGAGVLHVGRGLLGESVQNAVHRLVGSEEEDLRYAADHRLYPLATLTLVRPLPVSSNLGSVTGRIEAVAAPGFHSSLRAGVQAERSVGAGLAVLAGVAGVLHDVDSGLLGDAIASSGVAWDLGVGWRDLFLVLSHNAYGTETRHLTLGYRFSVEPVEGVGRARRWTPSGAAKRAAVVAPVAP